MKARYDDIIAKAGAPLWWDENGVPRYAQFEPFHCDPAARQAALLKAACIHCRRDCYLAVSSRQTNLDIMSDLAARGMSLYGLLPHFDHCGRINMGELLGIVSIWRLSYSTWRQVFSIDKA